MIEPAVIDQVRKTQTNVENRLGAALSSLRLYRVREYDRFFETAYRLKSVLCCPFTVLLSGDAGL